MVCRNNEPLTQTRRATAAALAAHEYVDWVAPQPWVRLEAFYSLVQQSTLRAGGRLSRNRIGFQIVDFQAYEDPVMDEPRFDPLDYVSVFNRRKWWFIVPVTLALLIGGLLVWQLPRTYQASTTIAVSAARVVE